MKNAYVEITNICNLNCDFCPGHSRQKRHMTASEFEQVAKKLNGNIENLFLHIMGEPLLHPELEEIIAIADRMDVKLKITTNGTLLTERISLLCDSRSLQTVCISLHSFEGNSMGSMAELKLKKYLASCIESASLLAKKGKYVVLRLWNLEGDDKGNLPAKNTLNSIILRVLEKAFPPSKEEWVKTHRGMRIATHVFLEWGERFDWPDISEAENLTEKENVGEYGNDNCHGLLTQVGILTDGTIVPCCLDRNGDIPLGNIFETTLQEALEAPRARAMKEAMAHHRFIEPLCLSCGFRRK